MPDDPSQLKRLARPTPVLDTSNLAAILALPDLPLRPGEAKANDPFGSTSPSIYNVVRERESYRKWLKEAKLLAQNGATPGPTHYRAHNGELYPTWSGAFENASNVQGEHKADPLVILGVALQETDITVSGLPYLPPNYQWRALTTQSGGVACHHPRFIGLQLEIKKSELGAIYRLAAFADNNGHTCLSSYNHTLTQLTEYAQELTRLNLSAEHTYKHLEEAVYPLDYACAKLLSDTNVPEPSDLYPPVDEAATLLEQMTIRRGIDVTNWGVFVFGDNCD